MDKILVVDCLKQTQISRVTVRDELSPQTIEQIISMQASRELRVSTADLIIFNDNITLQLLASEVHRIAVQIGL